MDDAFGNLNRKYAQGCSGPKCEDEFDDDTGTLTSYFWAVERCADAKLCDVTTAQEVYCDDFRKYYCKYFGVHHKERTNENFKGWGTLLSCLNPERRGEARFSQTVKETDGREEGCTHRP